MHTDALGAVEHTLLLQSDCLGTKRGLNLLLDNKKNTLLKMDKISWCYPCSSPTGVVDIHLTASNIFHDR